MPTITQRADVPAEHANEKVHRRLLAERANVGLPIDGTKPMLVPLKLASYTVATAPTASLWEGAIIYVSNESGGKVPAFSDGTNWRRYADRAVIS